MTERRITVCNGVHLSGIQWTDKTALLEQLRTKDVYTSTLNIPHPYTEADADWWIENRLAHTKSLGREATFAIRDDEAKLIGVVGADDLDPGAHRAEIGYWLARDYWGRGIMTQVARIYVSYAFDTFNLQRLTAHVFEFNAASARVLEKNGFKLEGLLRRHLNKEGQLLDARLYGLLKEEFI